MGIREWGEVGADKDKAMDTGATPLYIAAVDKLSG
jgi:hypothetical protein